MADQEASWRPHAGMNYAIKLDANPRRRGTVMHTLRYSFKPSSGDWKKCAEVTLRGQNAEVCVPSTLGTNDLLFRGKAETHRTTECLLMCDAEGKWTLTRLSRSLKNLVPERE